jgi:protein TonB
VYLKFVVSAKGKVEQVQVTRGVDKLLDDEAVRVVKLLPDFKPGMQGGRAVAVWYSVPIVFKLN